MAGSRLRAITAMVVSFAVIAAACDDGGGDDAATSTTATVPPSDSPRPTGDAPRVFGLNLSEGEPASGSGSRPDLVVGENLPADRIDEILARLPEWDLALGEQQEFNWPIESTPPPRTGNVIDVPFPPNDQTPPEDVPTGPLEVVRFQPEGDVPVAPYLAITFNQPMVPIGSLAQVDALDVPVSIAPAIDGRWQWIGTRTLRFDYSGGGFDRLPMATTYTVTVPAGTESATGGELADTVEFTFTTPAPTVQSFSPEGDSLSLEQLFAVVFDQRIDPAAVLATIHLRAGDDEVGIRLATDAEIAADDSARNIREQAADGRWLVFRPVDPLPTDTPLRIEIGPGVPSAEGPAKSGDPKVYIGRTYAPLRVTRVSCSWSEQCPPGSDLIVEFNNMLDVDRTDPDTVAVSPELAGRLSGVQGSAIIIRGATLARTEYTLTIPASVVDVFGQSLGEARTETVTIGSAAPSLQQYGMVTTLDPLAPRQELTVRSVNHDELRVRVFAASLDDMAAYWKYANERDYNGSPLPDWPVLADETVEVDGEADLESLTPIDLQRFLDGQPGHLIVLVDPVPAVKPDDPDYWQNRPALTWVQSTSIGADAVIDAERAVVWATDLSSGAPLAGVQVQITGASAGATTDATTDADGLAELALPSSMPKDPQLLVATLGDDTAVLPVYAVQQAVTDEVRWHVIDDRQVYRPGETMVVKGWARILQLTGDASLRMPSAAATVEYQLVDSYGNELLEGATDLGALGGFDLSLEIPETANLGQATLNLRLIGESNKSGIDMWHPIQILQYRTPEFEVVTRAVTQPPFLSTKPATVTATATYYAGGPLPGAPADWLVTTTPTTYSPPGWDGFTFGIFQPWWIEDSGRGMYEGGYPGMYYEGPDVCCGPTGEAEYAEYHGTTGDDGSHYLQIGFEGADGVLPDLPVAVSAEATVTDVNRQAWASRTDLLVHPSDRYVGLRATRSFVRQGEPLDVEVIVTGVDGAAAPGTSITLVAGRVEWTYEKGQWKEVVVDEQQCTKVTAAEPVTCTFDTALGGEYRVTAVVTGTDGGHSRTQLTAWVTGASARPSTQVELETLTVVPDKADYAPGDTAELMVQAPWTTGEGIATITHHGIRNTQRFQIVDGTAVLEVPIENGDVPQVTVTLEVVGATARTAPDGTELADLPARPAYAAGQITLPVPPTGKTLGVEVTPRDAQVVPGGETTIDVTVTDAAGNPVEGAEFAIVVVDEAVLALTGYQLTNPVGTFYGSWYEQLQMQYARAQIRLLDSERFGVPLSGDDSTASTIAPADAPEATHLAREESADYDAAGDNSAGRATGGGDGGGGDPIDVRSAFDALALFEPDVTTGADGTAAVPLTLPDNLTRYRVMVVAASGADRFGSGESDLTARLPLSARPSAPRFANYGDIFQLPIVVQNQQDNDLVVDVVLQTANLTPAEPIGQQVTVPANGRVEVRFPVATDQAGTAGFRVAVVSGDLADAAVTTLPVYTPATAEAFATYGTIDSGSILQPVLAPDGVIEQFGGLEITTSSTAVQALTDAVIYLNDYPYDSSDGRASRILAISALRPVLEQFDADGLPAAGEIDAQIRDDIQALAAMQNDDGGWPWWRKHDRSEPFNSVQVVHALLQAREAGYTVPQSTLDWGLAFIADIESHIPGDYGQTQRDTIRAYALWTRALAGQRDNATAEALFDERGDELQVDALAWLWGSTDGGTHTEIGRLIGNRAVDTAGAANFTTTYDDAAYVILHSDRRTDGIVLDALIEEDPDSDLIPKVVSGLLGHRVKGRWDNAEENAFILLALGKYFEVYEGQTPDFVARVWLGDRYAGDHSFEGRETDTARMDLPMTDVMEVGDSGIVIAKDGAGRLYYRIGLRYAPADLDLDALDRGFVVARTYEAVDDPSDVRLDANGVWHVKAGARVRVRLTMVAESQRTHVALIDPLPAGFEALNPDLQVTQSVIPEEGEDGGPIPVDDGFAGDIADSWYWWGPWYQYQQLRDDRTEAFTTFLSAGTYSYSYVARATTPGEFVVPPARAEEMYAPETFGRSATTRVVIE